MGGLHRPFAPVSADGLAQQIGHIAADAGACQLRQRYNE